MHKHSPEFLRTRSELTPSLKECTKKLLQLQVVVLCTPCKGQLLSPFYINRIGSIKHLHLNRLARQIWQGCETRELWIYAAYVGSKDNYLVDHASRFLSNETEWELSEKAYRSIRTTFGNPEIDLFASYLNHKCATYVP